jgi:multidrug efflux pump subunit AcrA (membrane-fusion protein)
MPTPMSNPLMSIARMVVMALLPAAVLGAAGCDAPVTSMTMPQRITVDVVHPLRGAIAKDIDLPGDVVDFYEAALHSKVTGYLKSISVDKGDSVKKGQVLAEIQVPELQSTWRARRRASRSSA